MTILQAGLKRLIAVFAIHEYTFSDLFLRIMDIYGVTLGTVLETALEYNTSPYLTFADQCPLLVNPLREIYVDSNLTDFDDMILVDSYMSFHLSRKSIINLASEVLKNNASDPFVEDNPLMMLDKISAGYFVQSMFKDIERHYGLQLNRMYDSLFDTYTSGESLNNVVMVEVSTPRVETTISNKENFKQTTTDKLNYKDTVTEENQTYGYNSATPVDSSKSTTTKEGVEAYNTSTHEFAGGELDNNSETKTSHLGTDTFTRNGFEGKHGATMQDSLMKEIEIRKFDYFSYYKECFRKEMFVI